MNSTALSTVGSAASSVAHTSTGNLTHTAVQSQSKSSFNVKDLMLTDQRVKTDCILTADAVL